MNTFINNLQKANAMSFTDNGAAAYDSTFDKVYDLFAFGAAYRNRTDSECIQLFEKAYQQSPFLAIKVLFWIGDCRGGAGERRFFTVCFNHLCKKYPATAKKFLQYVPYFTRWDVLIKTTYKTPCWGYAIIDVVKKQLMRDKDAERPSLCAKWLPSVNASSAETKELAKSVLHSLGLTPREYRKMLSTLRRKIKVTEQLMSQNRWDEIEFDNLPSKAGLNYRKCFMTREETKDRYNSFMYNKKSKVNADTLFPYEVVHKVLANYSMPEGADRVMLNLYWDNLKDYLNGQQSKTICVCDTSHSMTWSSHGLAIKPIDVAISLSMYCAERLGGEFHNKFITFASKPEFVDLDVIGEDFVSRVVQIEEMNICQNTDLEKVFNLLFKVCRISAPEDRPETIVVISDMQIDAMTTNGWAQENCSSAMEGIRKEWAEAGMKMPRLVYWNVNASKNTILDSDSDVTFVSGASPALFSAIASGKSGYDFMLDIINNERYDVLK